MSDKEKFELAVNNHKGGNLAAAESGYRDILQRHSEHVAVHRNLGLLLFQINRWEDAWPHLKTASAIFENDVQLFTAMFKSATAMNRPDRAVSALKKVVALSPGKADLQRKLGRLFIQQKRFEEAISVYSNLIANDVDSEIEDYVQLGEAHWALDELVAAAEAYSAAVQRDETRTYERLKLIQCLEYLNKLNDAERHVDYLSEHEQEVGRTHFWRGCLHARRRNLDLAHESFDRVDPQSLPGDLSLRYWFEVGQLADKRHNPDAAMTAFETGNSLWKERYAPIMALKDKFTTTLAAEREAVKQWNQDNTPPIARQSGNGVKLGFMIGMPRSGTTLLDQLLSGHSQIHVLEERPHLEEIYTEFQSTADASRALTGDSLDTLKTSYLNRITEDVDGNPSLVIDKFPLNIVYVRVIKVLWPDAPIVLAMRHPCDVCLSNYMQQYRFNPAMAHFADLGDAVSTYTKVMTHWTDSVQALHLSPQTVRYEDVVTDAENVARTLFEHLEMPWEDQVLNTHTTAQSRLRIATPSYRQVTEPIHTEVVARWTRYFPWLEPHLETLRPFAEAYGYSVDL